MFLKLNFHFKIIIDLHVILNNTEISYLLHSLSIPLIVKSYNTVVQYHKQEIDINTTHQNYSDPPSLCVCVCVCVCVYVHSVFWIFIPCITCVSTHEGTEQFLHKNPLCCHFTTILTPLPPIP
jgi:hypothetical protein